MVQWTYRHNFAQNQIGTRNMRADPREHVADVNEVMRLLPPHAVVAANNIVTALGMEVVWMVDETTGQIERGSVIDTTASRYFRFEVFRPEGDGFDMVPLSDWLPCSTD